MVYANISGTTIKGPYPEINKDKEKHGNTSSSQHQQRNSQQQSSQQQSSSKNDKYGSWGPIFKNKENFVNMHRF
ncbi:hypothetical protein ALC60_10464 [Trachymyrmex zeteki]|uniref:Uncharacterized protein n=1 Tax=Mycetomoellerius zeteki TaxID=64791 RepID=A0A151WRM7_9HYME|nr:hypothetical protein ALC60_10464 [Trachymyrmex zeteki]